MKIDYSCPKTYCFIEMPYRYGGRHLQISFKPPLDSSGKSLISLKERVSHFAIGVLEVLLPIIGHIIALAEKYLHTNKTLPTPTLPVVPSTAPPVEVKTRNLYEEFKEAVANKDLSAAKKLVEQGFVLRDQGFLYCERMPDRSNLYHSVSPLYIAMINHDQAMFDFLMAQPLIDLYEGKHFPRRENPNNNLSFTEGSALHYACSLGIEGDYYIQKLIEKKCIPFRTYGKETALEIAKRKGVSNEVIQQLELYMKTQDLDANGLSKLQRSVQSGDIVAVKTAINEGACLNYGKDSNFGPPLHITIVELKQIQEAPDAPIKMLKIELYNRMITLLLDNGAHPDYGFTDCTPFLYLSMFRFLGWEKIAGLLLDRGANPCIWNDIYPIEALTTLDDDHVIKSRLIKSPLVKNSILLQNASTIWEVRSNVYIENKGIQFFEGGNQATIIYSLVNQIFKEFIKDPCIEGIVSSNILKALPDIYKFSLEMLTTSYDDITFAKLLAKIKSSELPVLIPSGWHGHSNAIVIWKNVIIKCNRNVKSQSGLIISQFDTEKLDVNCLKKMLHSPFNRKTVENKNKDITFFLYVINQELSLKSSRQISLEMQNMGNCTWSSSAFLGLSAIIALLDIIYNSVESDYIKACPEAAGLRFFLYEHTKEFNENFEHLAKYFTFKEYVKNLDDAVSQNLSLDANSVLLSNVKDKCNKALADLEKEIKDNAQEIKSLNDDLKSDPNLQDALNNAMKKRERLLRIENLYNSVLKNITRLK